MPKELAAALMAVIAIDKISFDNALYEPGSKLEGLTPDQAQGLVANGHAKHVTDEAPKTAAATPDAGGGAGDAGVGAEAATKAAAAKPAAAKTTAKK